MYRQLTGLGTAGLRFGPLLFLFGFNCFLFGECLCASAPLLCHALLLVLRPRQRWPRRLPWLRLPALHWPRQLPSQRLPPLHAWLPAPPARQPAACWSRQKRQERSPRRQRRQRPLPAGECAASAGVPSRPPCAPPGWRRGTPAHTAATRACRPRPLHHPTRRRPATGPRRGRCPARARRRAAAC